MFIQSPHYSSRQGRSIQGVVIHIMEGTLAGTDAWFQNPESRVSAHYGVGPHGEVHQYVLESHAAWHAGRVYRPTWQPALLGNPNLLTVGIEHHGYANTPWTDAELEASVALCAAICVRYGLPPDRQHIVGHREIYARKTCPGTWLDLDAYVQAVARAIVTAEPAPRPADLPVLRRGATGALVGTLQALLGVQGPQVFGPKTEAAVRQFQHVHGLAADGVVGRRTWGALLNHEAPK